MTAPLEQASWQSVLVNPNSRIYTDDKTWAGYVVNIAVLQDTLNTITKIEDTYIVNLNPVYLSYAGFKSLFYAEGTFFSPTLNLSNPFIRPEGSKYVLNTNRSYSVLPSDCGQCQLQLDGSFNLLKTLLLAYETDLKIATECWDTCSYMEFSNKIDKIRGLTDITGECGSGIQCSLSLDDFFAQLESQGLKMSGGPAYLPVDPSAVDLSLNGQSSIYPGLVTAVITANFKSTTPGVKDVQIRWPFMINFVSIVDDYIDESAGNTLWVRQDTLTLQGGKALDFRGIIDNSFSRTQQRNDADNSFNNLGGAYTDSSYNIDDAAYPVYVFINNDSTAGFRSPDLKWNTVDISNNVFYATKANSNNFDPSGILLGSATPYFNAGTNPNYTRYTAQKFSNIYWEAS
jgi:hypothetical protein